MTSEYSPEAVAVKGLVWTTKDRNVVANSPAASYCCQPFYDEWDLLIDGYHTVPKVHGVRKAHPTIDAAKAAAQADYETRIRSALAPASPEAPAAAVGEATLYLSGEGMPLTAHSRACPQLTPGEDDPCTCGLEYRKQLLIWRDCFAEITAKAAPYCADQSDPERITAYVIPAGPIHRTAGRVGFQFFGGEQAAAVLRAEVEALRAALVATPHDDAAPTSAVDGEKPGEGLEKFVADLRDRSKWHADRHNVQDAIRLQRSASYLEAAYRSAPSFPSCGSPEQQKLRSALVPYNLAVKIEEIDFDYRVGIPTFDEVRAAVLAYAALAQAVPAAMGGTGEMVEALRFYADPKQYTSELHSSGYAYTAPPILSDKGQRAIAALAGNPPGGEKTS